MPRANRYFTPGQIWHITHRCHKREFLLKFGKDRQRWLGWLFEAAVESGSHLIQCLVYIDLNMVRAGVVAHPGEWPYSGYNEIQTPRERYGLIDHERLTVLTGVKSRQEFKELHKSWIDEGLAKGNPFREDRWTESLAVGGEVFVKEIQEALGVRAISRSIIEDGDQQQLRDLQQPYRVHFAPEKVRLSQNIGLKWKIYPEI
jgi:putative transposase